MMPSLKEKINQRLQSEGVQQPPPNTLLPRNETGGNQPLSVNERIRNRMRQREAGVNAPNPATVDFANREAFLAGQVGTSELGEPGTLNLGVRADLGLSDTFQEKQSKFLSRFPEGDFVLVDEPPKTQGAFGTGRGGQTILFRKNQNEEFAELDADALEKFELLGDAADLAGEVPSIVAEVLITRGGGLVRQVLQLLAADVTGQAVKESVEELRGFQKETLEEIAGRQPQRAFGTVVGGAGSVFVSGPLNSLSGRGLLKTKPGGREALRAAREAGLPEPLPNTVAQSPLVRKIGGQSGAVVGSIEEYIQKGQAAMVRTLAGLRDADATRFLVGNLQTLHRDARNQLVKGVMRRPKDLSDGGSAVTRGAAEYEQFSRAAVDEIYGSARKIEAPDLDVAPAQSVAANVLEGVRVPGRGQAEVQLTPLQKDVAKLAEDVANIDPNLQTVTIRDGTEVSPVDQIRFLRSRAWNLKQAPINATPEQRAASRDANKIFAALDKTLKNPQNANPEFLKKWQVANAEAAKRFATLEKIFTVKAIQDETPAQLARRLGQPDQVDNIRLFKAMTLGEPKRLEALGVRVSPDAKARAAEDWFEFKDSVKSDLISPRNIDNLTSKLQSFDKATLDELFEPVEQNALFSVARGIDAINRIGVDNVIARHNQAAQLMDELLLSGAVGTRPASEFVEAAINNPNVSKKVLRAGLMEAIYNRVVKVRENVPVVDEAALNGVRDLLEQRGLGRLLTEGDNALLDNLSKVAAFLPARADSGTSIQAASVAAGALDVTTSALASVFQHMGVGRAFTVPWVRRALIGIGKEKRTFPSLRILGAELGKEAQSLAAEQNIGTENNNNQIPR